MKLIVTGTLPPPIGGVTIFLSYFFDALKTVDNVDAKFFSIKYLLSQSYTHLHINASNQIKRFLYVLLGRLFFKKVFIVKHGNKFYENSFFDMWSLKLCHGVFCLNDGVVEQMERLNVPCLKHSTIFSENSVSIEKKTGTTGSIPKLLFYINNNHKINNRDLYGADFIIDFIRNTNLCFELTVVDLSGKYKHDFNGFENVIYLSDSVDFKSLLANSDYYIRPTASDGMSVAVLEAGLIGIPCICSDVVDRPEFVTTYKFGDHGDFERVLGKMFAAEQSTDSSVKLSSVKELMQFMSKAGK